MDFSLTLIVAFAFVLVALLLLGIGWLITGKAKIQAGSCGRDPHKKKTDNCGSDVSCTLCERHDEEKKN